MPPLSQKDAPIGLVLFGDGPTIPFVWGGPGNLGCVRPESVTLSRPSRGAVLHTARDAFLDDYGAGVPQLVLSGHTGWNQGGIPGLAKFLLLESLFVEYLQRRQDAARAGRDPATVQLWYVDALNAQAFSVYPHEFRLDRTRQRPLLYLYHLRFAVLADLLRGVAGELGGAILGVAAATLGDAAGRLGELAGL